MSAPISPGCLSSRYNHPIQQNNNVCITWICAEQLGVERQSSRTYGLLSKGAGIDHIFEVYKSLECVVFWLAWEWPLSLLTSEGAGER
ncbi:hypothetical protein GOP47_0009326 [Adiantum capillus-veneris]|uniref:Uncharacterized protein n=1 Tax=Adiantum capillus-veneris TaxID=13818 RepID=A0A9D4ZJJ8_ADICA|nr:hypothetical protein GOP47_0009326 [Adiantum capillus-veneris]